SGGGVHYERWFRGARCGFLSRLFRDGSDRGGWYRDFAGFFLARVSCLRALGGSWRELSVSVAPVPAAAVADGPACWSDDRRGLRAADAWTGVHRHQGRFRIRLSQLASERRGPWHSLGGNHP